MPPTITKQRVVRPSTNGLPKATATVPSSRRVSGGTLLETAQPVDSLEDFYIKILLYGKNRTGKTTLACQFPKPLLLIAFEPSKTGGARSVMNVPGVDYIKITSKAQALQLAGELKGDTKYKTHVIDSATSLQDIVLSDILGLETAPVQLNWGSVSLDQYRERSEQTREVLRPFLSLNAHTVVTAKERDHNAREEMKPKQLRKVQVGGDFDDLEIHSWIAADLGGATAGWLNDSCEYLGRLYLEHEVQKVVTKVKVGTVTRDNIEYVRTGKHVRKLRTLDHPNFGTGFRSCLGKVPETVLEPTFDKILAVIAGEHEEAATK